MLTKVQRLTEARIRAAADLACIPGITVGEVREYLRLDPTSDDVGKTVLNLPSEDPVTGVARRINAR